MTIVEFAAILAAIALVVLVALVAVPMIRLNTTIRHATEAIEEFREQGLPLLARMNDTVDQANAELHRLRAVTDDAGRVAAHAAEVSDDAAQFSSLMSAALGKPLIKTAAFTYGLRKALEARQ